MAEDSHDHHVRFTSDTHLDPEPIHLLEPEDPDEPSLVNLGILRSHHTYSVEIPIPHSMGATVNASHDPNNIHVTIMEPPRTVEGKGENVDYITTVVTKVNTVQEGSIAERIEIFVVEGDTKKAMEVLVISKVLKPNQGNPLLKYGIHVLSHQHIDEEDFTEWPKGKRDEIV